MKAEGMNVGYQLYSAREEARRDFEGTLERLAEMGYEGVEFCGYYGWEAKPLAKLMKRLGLKPLGGHVSLERAETDPRAVIDYHTALGAEYIAVSGAEGRKPGEPGFSEALRALGRFGRLCRKSGLALLYHNHQYDFEPVSGQPGLDFLLNALPAKGVQSELDAGWAQRAGADPVAYLERYAGRVPVLHLKDYVEDADGGITFKPVGYGCLNLGAVMNAARKAGVRWAVVDQDEEKERAPLEAAKLSLGAVLGALRD